FCTYVLWQVDVKNPSNEGSGTPVFDQWIGSIRGSYSMRSTDGGKTWDEPIALPGTEPIGQESIQLTDDSVLCCSYSEDIVIYRTINKGSKWFKLATIPKPAGYSLTDPVLYQTDSGKVVCYARGVPDGGGERTRLITAV